MLKEKLPENISSIIKEIQLNPSTIDGEIIEIFKQDFLNDNQTKKHLELEINSKVSIYYAQYTINISFDKEKFLSFKLGLQLNTILKHLMLEPTRNVYSYSEDSTILLNKILNYFVKSLEMRHLISEHFTFYIHHRISIHQDKLFQLPLPLEEDCLQYTASKTRYNEMQKKLNNQNALMQFILKREENKFGKIISSTVSKRSHILLRDFDIVYLERGMIFNIKGTYGIFRLLVVEANELIDIHEEIFEDELKFSQWIDKVYIENKLAVVLSESNSNNL